MKLGWMVAYRRDVSRIVISKDVMTMDEFISRSAAHGVKFSSQDVLVLPMHADKAYADSVKKALVTAALFYVEGNDNPAVVSAARNTSLFGMRGPLMGDVPNLPVSLMELVSLFTDRIPAPPELPRQHGCADCNRSIPEPDGFMGVWVSDDAGVEKRICFECYQKKYAGRN